MRFAFRPNANQLYAAKSQRTQRWHRALGYDWSMHDVSVLFLDSGLLERVPFTAIHNLQSHEDFIPFQAVCCAVAGVAPARAPAADSSRDWPAEQCSFIRKLGIVGNEFRMRIEAKDDVRAYVDLIDSHNRSLKKHLLANPRLFAAARNVTAPAAATAVAAPELNRTKPAINTATKYSPSLNTRASETVLQRDVTSSAFRPAARHSHGSTTNGVATSQPAQDAPRSLSSAESYSDMPALEAVSGSETTATAMMTSSQRSITLSVGQHNVNLPYFASAAEFYAIPLSDESNDRCKAVMKLLQDYASSGGRVHKPRVGEVAVVYNAPDE